MNSNGYYAVKRWLKKNLQNDIGRIQEIYTSNIESKQHSMMIPLFRQTIVISKFQSLDLQCLLDSQTFNRKGRLEIVALEPNRAR